MQRHRARIGTRLHLVAAIVLSSACMSREIADPRHLNPGGIHKDEGCPIIGPTPDGCPLQFDTDTTRTDMATADVAGSGSEPEWHGEDPSYFYGTVLFECPPYVDDPKFRVYIVEDGLDVSFAAHGRWMKIANLGVSVYGEPMAEYAAPPGGFYSFDPFGRYIAYGGSLQGRCKTVRLSVPKVGTVWVGPILFYNYTGTVERTNAGGGDEGDRGWASDFSGFRNGSGFSDSGETYQSVLDAFIGEGRCTVGWEIWVAGVQQCDAMGHLLT